MRARLLLRTVPVLLLAALAVGCSDDDGDITVSPEDVVESTSTSVEGNDDGETNTATDDPVDAPAGRAACEDLPPDAAGADPAELRSIAENAPADVAAAIEELVTAGEGGDPAEVEDATEQLVEVCQAYGIELEQTSAR